MQHCFSGHSVSAATRGGSMTVLLPDPTTSDHPNKFKVAGRGRLGVKMDRQ